MEGVITSAAWWRVPSLAEILSAPTGPTMVSTFSGCGGSCLGFRWAGFRIPWSSEFISVAADTYEANFPGTHVDRRDIREVKPAEILQACGLREGELDLLEGSPPCAAFSSMGAQEQGWGQVRKYSETEQRVDDLFFEWVRLARGLRPRALVAENVTGLAGGRAKGYLKEILRSLEALDYQVEARILDAQWLGVPQSRSRLIIQGVRKDLGRGPQWPLPEPQRVTLREALLDLDPWGESTPEDVDVSDKGIGRYYRWIKPGGKHPRYFGTIRCAWDRPAPCLVVSGIRCRGSGGLLHPEQCRKFTVAELKRICGFPDDFAFLGNHFQRAERMARAVPPPMSHRIAKVIRGVLECAG